MKKKLVKASLSTLALSMVLAGCGSKEETQSSTSSTAPVSSATSAAPVEFSWLQMNIPGNNTITQQYVEKLFNVKIKPIGYDRSNWQQQINIKLASGEKPDLFGNTDLGFGDFLNYQKQGLIGEISVDTIRKYAPNYSKMIDDFDKSAWEVGMIGGKNYGIPKFYSEGGSPFIPAYNEAWLKKIGYSAPPKTLAELDDVLTKFRNNDPDGNGKKDTYGISARGKDTLGSNQIFNTVFAAHGVRPAGWILVDGKVQLGLASEQAREAYKMLNKWYKDGIIDPEFVTDDNTSNRAKFASGKIGMFDQGQWTTYHKSGLLGMDAQKAGVSLAVGTPVIGPAGKMLGIVQGFKQSPFALGADTVKDEKKVEAILKIIDKTATDKEVYIRTTYGELGVHYDMVDGGPVMKAEYADVAKASASIGTSSFVLGSNPVMVQYEYPSEKQAFKVKANDKNITLLADVMQLKILPSWDANKAALEKMLKEYQLKFIVGEVDLDKGFDNYVAELNKIGLEKATAEANEIYSKTKK
jgi:putative aldouronate transport system substrate-binding protein